MELQHIALAISAANFVLTWGVALYMYLANKNKVTNERITSLQEDFDGKLDDHATRIARLEEQAKMAPTHDDLGELYKRINSVDSAVSKMNGTLESVDASLRALTSELMKRGLGAPQ